MGTSHKIPKRTIGKKHISYEDSHNVTHTENLQKVLNDLITKHPYILDVLEAFGVNHRWCLHSIWEYNDQITFYCHQSMLMPFTAGELITKHKVSFQVPGNTDYNFNITIHI
jgi:hypothetical protein